MPTNSTVPVAVSPAVPLAVATASPVRKICWDIHSNRTPAASFGFVGSMMMSVLPTYAILVASTKWQPGTKIGVNFLGGTNAQQDVVVRAMQKWLDFTKANLSLAFGVAGGQVRVSFDENLGSWSYIGTDCVNIPGNMATMNFGWLDEAVVLHEFGHCLGLGHEHSSPLANPIHWNRDVVLADAGGPPNYWSPEVVKFNIFDRYSVNQVNGTDFDPKSIMLYYFPADWTTDGLIGNVNTGLSAADIALVRAQYPPVQPYIPNLPISRMVVLRGTIVPNQVTEFELNVVEAGTYAIETDGNTDCYVSLYSGSAVLGEDDDSGVSSNSLITIKLGVGKYKVSVRHYNKTTGFGPFGIKAVQVLV